MSKMSEHFERVRRNCVMVVRRKHDIFSQPRKWDKYEPASTLELLSGMEFPHSDYRNDVHNFLDPILSPKSPHRLPWRLRASLEAVRDNPGLISMRVAERACMAAIERSAGGDEPMLRETVKLVEDASERIAVWLAAIGCQRAAARCAGLCLTYWRERNITTYPDVVTYGLMRSMIDYIGASTHQMNARKVDYIPESRHFQLALTEGALRGLVHILGVVQEGIESGPHDKHDPDESDDEAPLPPVDLADLSHLDDDRAGIVRDPPKPKSPATCEPERAAIAAPPPPVAPGLVVVWDVGHVKRGMKGDDPVKDAEPILSKHLPLVTPPADLAVARAELLAECPHGAAIVDRLLRPLAAQETVRNPPILIVGEPGGGKTRLARRYGEVLGLHPAVYSMGGAMDAMAIAGVSRGWSTGGFSAPMREIIRTKIANPLLVIDEVDKIGTSRHNGNAADALINQLGVETAARYRDVYLQADCDLSRVQWILTANTLAGIPRPLLDRCTILRLDEPGPQHLQTLATSILADVRADRGLDETWAPPLDGVEWAALEEHWPGGSLRALRRLIEAVLDARDAGPRQ